VRAFIFFLILFLIAGCGKKMDPTLEDYLQPSSVREIKLSAFTDKIVVSWSYPEKNKLKISSFLLERESDGQKKSLGFLETDVSSYEDKDFTFGQTYKYRIFAVNKKGIYSDPVENMIAAKKLPEIERLNYQITPDGVLLSWNLQNEAQFSDDSEHKDSDSLMFNIYRISATKEKIKKGSTDKSFFLDEMSSSMFKSYALTFLTYFVTPYVSTESTYIEGQGTEITIPLEEFIPSEPQEIFWTVNENGVYISWREVPEKWIKAYRIYRMSERGFVLIGESLIPLFFDSDYKRLDNEEINLKYKITVVGPAFETQGVVIDVR